MTGRRWLRRSADRSETRVAAVIAAGAAAAVGLGAFYVTRVLLARDEIGPVPPPPSRVEGPAERTRLGPGAADRSSPKGPSGA